VLLWVHLAATGLFVGATAGVALFAVPAANRVVAVEERRRRLARALRLYDPLAIALLGIMVMTGAWSVTSIKQDLGQAYFASFGEHLAWKLASAFLTVMAGTYLTMGLGHRLVRSQDFEEPIDERRLAGVLTRLRATAWVTIALTGLTIVVALRGAP
jgi:uncharacterized membrane protein